MLKLMILLAVSMCLAFCSQKGILVIPVAGRFKIDIPLIVMIVMLSLFTGLRTQFNDTPLYIASFNFIEFNTFFSILETCTWLIPRIFATCI